MISFIRKLTIEQSVMKDHYILSFLAKKFSPLAMVHFLAIG